MSNNALYTRKMLSSALKSSNISKQLEDDYLKSYNAFVNNEGMTIPSEQIGRSVLTKSILEYLNVTSKKDLVYKKGCFVTTKSIDASLKQAAPKGLTIKTIQVTLKNKNEIKKIFPNREPCPERSNNNKNKIKPWINYQFPIKKSGSELVASKAYLFHRAHIFPVGFRAYALEDKYIKGIDDNENFFKATTWVNQANHNKNVFGINQSYIENSIAKALDSNRNLTIRYKVSVLTIKNETIPRGIHIQVTSYLYGKRHRDLKLFIPNVDSRFVVDYKKNKKPSY